MKGSAGERGSAGLLALVAMALVVSATAFGGALVAGAVSHTRAQSTADLTALAVASRLLTDPDPCAVGVTVARGNGGELVDCRLVGATATVAVAVPLPPVLAAVLPDRHAGARSRAEVVVVP